MTIASDAHPLVQILEVDPRDGFRSIAKPLPTATRISTGIDLQALLAVADEIAELPAACGSGHLRGVPRERAVAEMARASR